MQGITKTQRLYIAAGLFMLTVLTRLPLMDPMLFNMDSVSFAVALDKFDVSLFQPHPPGYFLYVMSGRLARLFTGDANTALVYLSIIFSALTVSLLYIMGSSMFGDREGLGASLVALASPLFWLHGVVALSYAAEGFIGLLIAWLCWRMLKGDSGCLWPSAVVLGLGGGFRQTTIIFLAPLWLYSIRRQGLMRVIAAMGLVVLSFLSWFLPMLYLSGGYERYLEATHAQAQRSVWHGFSLSYIAGNAGLQIVCITWGLMAALPPLILRLMPSKRKAAPLIGDRGQPFFFLFWLAPSILFYVFIMSTAIAPGYSLIYLVGIFLLAGKSISLEADRISKKTARARLRPDIVWAIVTALILAINSLSFIFLDYPFSYKGINNSGRMLRIYLEGLRKNFPPHDTVVIGSEYIFLNSRHVSYYLPEYPVYHIPVMVSASGNYYFRFKDRNTEKAASLVVPEGTKYVVYFIPCEGTLPEAAVKSGARLLYLGEGHYLIYFKAPLGDNYKTGINEINKAGDLGPSVTIP